MLDKSADSITFFAALKSFAQLKVYFVSFLLPFLYILASKNKNNRMLFYPLKLLEGIQACSGTLYERSCNVQLINLSVLTNPSDTLQLFYLFRTRPTLLLPFWEVAGYALGAGTALMGKEAAMACTVAVEVSFF